MLHPVPLRLVRLTLVGRLLGPPVRVCATTPARLLPNGTVPGHRCVNGRGAPEVPVAESAATVARLLDDVQASMLASAVRRRDERTAEVTSIADAVEAAKVGFARIPWALLADGGEKQLAQDAISVRCLQRPDGTLPASEDEPEIVATVARSY